MAAGAPGSRQHRGRERQGSAELAEEEMGSGSHKPGDRA